MNFPSHWVHHLLPLLEALYNVSIKQRSFSWKLLSFCCSSHTEAVPHPPCLDGQDFSSLFLHNFRSPLYTFVPVPALDFDIYSSFLFPFFTSLIYFWKAITSLYSLHFVRLREIDFSNLLLLEDSILFSQSSLHILCICFSLNFPLPEHGWPEQYIANQII